MTQTNKPKDEQPSEALVRARGYHFTPPAYLKTRVLAELSERRGRAVDLRRWRWLAVGSATMAMAAVLWISLSGNHTFQAVTGKPFVVRVEMEALDRYRITHAEIQLPDGIRFYSESIPGLEEKKSLTLAWNKGVQSGQFPFVIRADREGSRVVVVRFLDENRELVAERRLKIYFSKAPEGRES